jgi:hypothetical protein
MDMNEERRQRIARQIVQRSAIARGVLVVDEDVQALASALRGANIKVVVLPPETKDEKIKEELLYHRIMVTRNSADFIHDAPIHEYGVISLANLSVVDTAPEYAKNKTAQMISKALSDYNLWSKGAKFLLELRENDDHSLCELS